jgi:tripartite-type tricarboxylate transporter receptor subunit TctC
MRGIKIALGVAAGVATLCASAPAVRAESNYPNRAIHVIVPFPAGGIVDIVARAVTEQVGRDFKQTVVVQARPGANGNIGTSAVARSAHVTAPLATFSASVHHSRSSIMALAGTSSSASPASTSPPLKCAQRVATGMWTDDRTGAS